MNKPLLGVCPAWYILPIRIEELAEAISRYAKHEEIMSNKEIIELIETWAKEIMGHCKTIETIQKK